MPGEGRLTPRQARVQGVVLSQTHGARVMQGVGQGWAPWGGRDGMRGSVERPCRATRVLQCKARAGDSLRAATGSLAARARAVAGPGLLRGSMYAVAGVVHQTSRLALTVTASLSSRVPFPPSSSAAPFAVTSRRTCWGCMAAAPTARLQLGQAWRTLRMPRPQAGMPPRPRLSLASTSRQRP